jgi:PAS domain S-box-containing protein
MQNSETNESLENIQDGFFTLDREWRFSYVNKRVILIVGLEPEELIGKVIWEVSPEINGTDLENVCRKAMETLTVQRITINSAITDSWYNIIVFPSYDGISVYWQDITVQKQTEMELQMIGKTPFDLMPPDMRECALEEFIKIVNSPSGIKELKTTAYDGLGNLIFNETSGVPFFDDSGVLRGYRGVTRDITVRKIAEEALKESEERFRAYVTASSDMIYCMNADWSVMRQLNGKGLLPNTKGPYENWLQKYIHPEDQPQVIAVINKAIREKSILELEHRVLHADGSLGWTFSRTVPLMNAEGEIVEWFGAAKDITDRKKSEKKNQELIEQLCKADQNKNTFLNMLSHELRNPLASIMMSLSLLDRVSFDGEQALRAREIAIRQGKQLTHLVDDLLDVTRINQNKITLKKERIELNTLVKQTVADYQGQFIEKKVVLEAKLTSAPLYLEADPARLTQIIGNLLHNASKFTSQGDQVLVTVYHDKSTLEAIITVQDNGIGIKPELLPDLFQLFMQVDSTLDRSCGGLGLGLAVVKGMVELHGGSVAAHSKGLGSGTQFTMRLPVKNLNEEEQEGSPKEITARSFRILVIEDIPDIAEILCSLLGCLGHEAIAAFNGSEGMAKAKEFQPEVVICDIGLPGMSGYEVARSLRSDKELKDIFLIALSGYAQPDDLEQSREAGFNMHLAKPVDLSILEQTLSGIYDEKMLNVNH